LANKSDSYLDVTQVFKLTHSHSHHFDVQENSSSDLKHENSRFSNVDIKKMKINRSFL